MERGVEGPCVDAQSIARYGADELGEAVSVARAPAERLENDEIERALEQLDAGRWRERGGARRVDI